MEIINYYNPSGYELPENNNEPTDNSKTKGRSTRLGILLGMSAIIVVLLIVYSDGERAENTIKWLFDHPPATIAIIGFFSLVVSLIVFSFSWYLRDSESQSAMEVYNIQKNLREVKDTLGEPAFTNLLNGLSSAAKEELVFPEPIGVFRHKEFRRALTISVALTYFAILGFSTTADQAQAANFKENPIIQAFAWVFVAVIAFYFGDKIFENYVKSKGIQVTANQLDPITITDATISEDGKELIVVIRNNLKSKIKITKIQVDGKTHDYEKLEIEGEKSATQKLPLDSKGKIVTVEIGPLTFEKEIKENKPSVNNS